MEGNTVDSKAGHILQCPFPAISPEAIIPSDRIEQTAADYLDPTSEPEPSAQTGLGTHFGSTYDPSMKKEAPRLPAQSAPQASAQEKLASTSSSMTTAQLQAAAAEGDPNNLQRKK